VEGESTVANGDFPDLVRLIWAFGAAQSEKPSTPAACLAAR
jgi:hypothetical protein